MLLVSTVMIAKDVLDTIAAADEIDEDYDDDDDDDDDDDYDDVESDAFSTL